MHGLGRLRQTGQRQHGPKDDINFLERDARNDRQIEEMHTTARAPDDHQTSIVRRSDQI
jgi:hypothetical protein